MILLAGSGHFGAEAAVRLVWAGYRIGAVAAPVEGRRTRWDPLGVWASRAGVPVIPATELRAERVPPGTALILAAHSHSFVGARTRARVRYSLGYHPSLLPLHRGRDAVRWQSRLGERVIGGTIYHLTDRVDGGAIALQRHLVVRPALPPSELWSDYLAPLGLDMIVEAAGLAAAGTVPYVPQDDAAATWEPALSGQPLYRPELPQLPPGLSDEPEGGNRDRTSAETNGAQAAARRR